MLIVYCVSPVDTHKPYFIHDNQTYFIEDIASYHIHAGDYFIKKSPKGGHSNYDGNKLDCFNPTVNELGPLGSKYVTFYNSRFASENKKSSIYPEAWSEYICDLKTIEIILSNKKIIKISDDLKSFNITGYTSEGLEIKICYDILAKRIKTHHLLI